MVRYELLIGSYLRETAARLRRTLDYARTTCWALFFDEVDAIAKERGHRRLYLGLRLCIRDDLGTSPATIAKRLGKVRYAEAEEFCLDIRRAQILATSDRPLKAIVQHKLELWKRR